MAETLEDSRSASHTKYNLVQMLRQRAYQGVHMRTKRYLVTQDHTSEYPRPITFKKGALLTVGKKYEGPEGWNDWFFCSTTGQESGWVPAQVIEIISGNKARAREDYTAKELNVQKGDQLLGSRTLNGWVWCENPSSSRSGWVPLSNLQEVNQ